MKLQFSGIFNLFLLLCFAASSPCRAQSPAIFNISPDVGRAGEKVVITGNNFGLVSNVRFGNKEAIFTIYNNSTIVAIAPEGLNYDFIKVVNTSGESISKQKFKTNLYTAGGEVARGHIVEAGTLSTVFEFLSDPLLLQSMASVGDFNMDGVNDLAVGNIFDDDGGFRRGAVWIFFLNRDMEIIGRKKISNLKGNFKGELNNFDQFGFSITSIGDHNGDGVPDLAVGSFNMVSNRGSLWILFMNSDGTVKSHYQHTDLGTRGARLGQAMASVGDLDGDGVQEIAIGDPVVNGNTGAVYVLFLNADGSIKKSTTIANGIGLTRGKSFGETISPAGDVNQDGTPDLFVSASDSPSYLQSAIWVVFLNNNGESIGAHAITLKNGKFNEPEKLSFFGLGFCSPQDINFDNIPDLLVNTVNEGNLPPHIYALTLNGDGSVKENKLIFSGSRGDEESGFLMTFIGDNDDNGYPEVAFLSGPPWIPDAGVDVISLGVPSLIIVDNPNDPLNPISDPATIVNFPPTYAGVPTSLIFDIHAITFDNVLTLPIERPDITGEFTALNTNFPSPRGITSAESPFQLEVQFNAPKAKGAYTGTISVQTGDFTRFPVIFKLSATVINSPPEEVYLDNNHVPENNVANVTIGNLITKDRDDVDTHTYALISGIGDKDNAYFTIVGNRLVFNTSTDFETLDHYEIRVRSIDNEGASVETPLIVHVMNQAEPPTVSPAVAEIPENSPVATPVFTVVAQDPDNTPLTFGIVEGNDGDAFAINSSGQITVNNSASLDFEEHPIFELTIQVTDPDGLQAGNRIIIKLLDVNDPPRVSSAIVELPENSPVTTSVFAVTALDQDNTPVTFTIAGGNDGNAFTISSTGLISVNNSASLDFETHPIFELTVQATDPGGLHDRNTIVINLLDVNEPPTDITLSNHILDEHAPIATPIGLLSAADPDAHETHTFELATGPGSGDNSSFSISGLQLLIQVLTDYSIKKDYTIRVKVTDMAGNVFEKDLTIHIEDDGIESVFIPTLFSPNDDGSNDHFFVAGDDIKAIAFAIYNQFGNEVYSTTDIDLATHVGWDGKQQGEDAPPGVYVWKLDGVFQSGKPISVEGRNIGTVILIR